MKSKITILRWIYALAVVGVMSACVSDVEFVDNGKVDPSATTEITFVIDMPAASLPTTTRAIGETTTNDNVIHDLFFLLFDSDGNYVDYVIPKSISSPVEDSDAGNPAGNKNLYTVKAVIPAGEYRALAVANWEKYTRITPDGMGASVSGMTIDQVVDDVFTYYSHNFNNGMAGIHETLTYSVVNESGCFVMGGCFDIPASRQSTMMLRMTRSLAKINVDGTAVDPDGSSHSGKTMTISEIRVINTYVDTKALPADVAHGSWNVFNRSHLNSGSKYMIDRYPYGGSSTYREELGLTYFNKDIWDLGGAITTRPILLAAIGTYNGRTNSSYDEIFVAETPVPDGLDENDPIGTAAAWKMAPALLIKGNLDGNDRWFRVNLRVNTTPEADEPTLRHVNILRNHKYTIHIKEIKSDGYATAREAYDGLPDDLVVDIDAVDESDMTITAYNGQYQLTINKDLFEFDYAADSDILKIYTDYPGGWKIENVVVDWITSPTLASTGGANSTVEQSVSVVANLTGAIRETTFDVVAGPLKIEGIKVVQRPTAGRLFAPPGVLGVGAKTGELTLRGSQEYKNTNVATRPDKQGTNEFGDIADETVYVVYFKWGSAIGVFGGTHMASFNSANDIAWVPYGYNSAGISSWSDVPWDNSAVPTGVEIDGWSYVRDGVDDPCMHADNGAFYNYMVPAGSVRSHEGWNYGMFNTYEYESPDPTDPSKMQPGRAFIWADNDGWGVQSVTLANGATVKGATPADWSMFLPYDLGYRINTGRVYNSPDPSGNLLYGNYWSKTAIQTGTGALLQITNNGGNDSGQTRELAYPIRCVKRVQQEMAGMYAPPGVLGVGAESGQLTLQGSNTYKGTNIQQYSDFGPLANEKVYIAYFKYGSAVAFGGGEEAEVVWRPNGYTKRVGSYNDVEVSSTAEGNHWPEELDAAKGLGDPCALANKGSSTGEWMVPSGGEDGWNGLSAENRFPWSSMGYTWYNMGDVNGIGALKNDWKMFLPAAVYREIDGSINTSDFGIAGYYWASLAGTTGFPAAASSLMITQDQGSNDHNVPRNRAMPIRCVPKHERPEPPITLEIPDIFSSGVLAPPGVLGYTASGKLTLEGSKEYKANSNIEAYANVEFGKLSDETVYVAYFKWGSMIATSSAIDPTIMGSGNFNHETDIVWAPPGYDGAVTVEDAREKARANMNSWGDITPNRPPSGNLSAQWTTNSDINKGWGDPCALAIKGTSVANWKIPDGGGGSGDFAKTWHNDKLGGFASMPFADRRGNGIPIYWISAGANPNPGVVRPVVKYAGEGLPAGVALVNNNDPWEIFLPMAGRRNASGNVEHQDTGIETDTSNSHGYYWSNQPNTQVGYGYSLEVKRNNTVWSIPEGGSIPEGFVNEIHQSSNYDPAHAIRCVK